MLISEYDYLTTVDRISLNENYAAACGPDGKLTLHWVSINLKKIIILTDCSICLFVQELCKM